MDILLTGRSVTPAEALRMGLVTRVVPDGKALEVARRIADESASCGPLAVQAILRTHRRTEGLDEAAALTVSNEIGWPSSAPAMPRKAQRPSVRNAPPSS